MVHILVGALTALALTWPAAAQVTPFPRDFRTQEVDIEDGVTIHLRAGGQGPAVVWAPLAADLVRDHTVVVHGRVNFRPHGAG